MFLTTAATRRPVAMSALLIALVLLGLNSYRKLSLENRPRTSKRTSPSALRMLSPA